MTLPKLAVIDDEVDLASFVCTVAENAGFDAEQFNNAGKFIDQYDKCADVIILDLMMPEVDGIEIIRFLAEIRCDALLILMSGFDSGVLHSAQKLATERGLNLAGSLNKPFRANQLDKMLTQLSIVPKSQTSNISLALPTADELRKALSNDELLVYYQPKVALNDNSIASVEALVRWQHPEYGLVEPDMFIHTAEKYGMIDDLTWIVFEKAMTQCRSWQDQGLTVHVAINVSAHTLKELNLPEKMGQMIQQHGLKPSQITIEITESALMQELVKSLDILTRLRMKGIRLSIDDFGTGYSSMIQLHRAPFSEIKIDQSFISEMEKDPEAATIVETIIMLGHKLNMKTVAEGVETKSCQEKLAKLNCDQTQGYLYARPMPGSEVFSWFEQHLQNQHSHNMETS